MRKAVTMVVVLSLLAIPAGSLAKPKGPAAPIPCPEDIVAAVAENCPCEGPMVDTVPPPWRNHGQYVRCVAKYRNLLRKSGCLDGDALRRIHSCAARSTCGKPERVLCCLSSTGTCSDTVADGTAEGVCSNDDDLPCDTDADCTKTRARITRNEDACLALDGEVAGEGSVCTPCLVP